MTAKKPVNGKAKGANFELTVAKAFTDAFCKKFRRTPMSGGWSHDNAQTAGDLVCLDDPGFPWCIECKNEEQWKLESLFTDKHAWFDGWWKQLIRECPPNKKPVLVFSRARQPIFIAVRFTDMSIHHTGWNHMVMDLTPELCGGCVIIMLLEDFLSIEGQRHVEASRYSPLA